jgi:hypothetical protein
MGRGGTSANSTVNVVGNTIRVSGESPVQIVDLTGKTLFAGQGNCSVEVPKGVYIVIVGEKQTKVAI